MSETAEKIIKQVEFYFSDSNLPNDRFLKAEIEKNSGWVKLETIASFQRLKSLTTDLEVIKEALKASTEIQLSEDGTLIKRVRELESVNLNPVTVFMTPFPFNYNQDLVEKALTDLGIKFKSCRLRTLNQPNGTRSFKGSILLELLSVEAVEELTKKEIEVPWKAGENFVVKPYEQFEMEGKLKDAQRQVKKQQDEVERQKKEAEVEASLSKFKPTPFEAGRLIAVSNMPSSGARENIFAATNPLELPVAFIDYDRGRPSGAIKFQVDETNTIQVICDKLNENAHLVDAESKPVFTVLSGEAETNEWDIIERLKEERLMAAKNGGSRGKRKFNPHGKKTFFSKKQRRN